MTEMDKLYEQTDDIGVAMMTTRRPDGHLVSRPMAAQKRAVGADPAESWEFADFEAGRRMDGSSKRREPHSARYLASTRFDEPTV